MGTSGGVNPPELTDVLEQPPEIDVVAVLTPRIRRGGKHSGKPRLSARLLRPINEKSNIVDFTGGGCYILRKPKKKPPRDR